jgi:hypothetical protein
VEVLGTTTDELLFVLFLLALVLIGTKIGDVGSAIGRRWPGASSPRDKGG